MGFGVHRVYGIGFLGLIVLRGALLSSYTITIPATRNPLRAHVVSKDPKPSTLSPKS